MEEPHEDQGDARRFLLGYLDEGERQIVAERLTADSDYLELVLQAESELMEDYVADQLSAEDRRRFDKYVLTNRQQVDQLNLTRALGASARVRAAANSPPMVARTESIVPQSLRGLSLFWASLRNAKLPIAAIILLTVCATVALILWRNHTDKPPQQARVEELIKLNAQQSLNANAIYQGFVIGPLKGGLVRDDQEVKAFTIPKTEELVQLRLQIGSDDYGSFQAILLTAEDRELFTLPNLQASNIGGQKVVVIYLPANLLTPADYQLRLSGLTRDIQPVYLGRYSFRIVSK
jgi:anti-sigma-K factor RskA